jgi:hypothetical protein
MIADSSSEFNFSADSAGRAGAVTQDRKLPSESESRRPESESCQWPQTVTVTRMEWLGPASGFKFASGIRKPNGRNRARAAAGPPPARLSLRLSRVTGTELWASKRPRRADDARPGPSHESLARSLAQAT